MVGEQLEVSATVTGTSQGILEPLYESGSILPKIS